MKFKASMDTLGWLITIGVVVLFIVVIASQYPILQTGNSIIPILVTAVVIATFIFSYAFHPSAYSLSSTELTILRPAKNAVYPFNDLASAVLVDTKDMRYTLRTFGVGGLFGYYGKFTNSKYGNMTWYASRRTGMILISTKDDKKIVVTPNDVDGFLAQFNGLKSL